MAGTSAAGSGNGEQKETARQLSLAGCVALKTGDTAGAKACLDKLLELDWQAGAADGATDISAYLTALQSLLAAAAKTRSEELFNQWLEAARIKITDAASFKDNSQKIAEFLIAITFIVSDRRFSSCYAVMQIWAQQLALKAADDVQRYFITEWIGMTAQFARRKWEDVSSFLLHTLLKVLLRSGDTRLMQGAMLRLNMHMAMYSRWDSFASAFAAYKPVQLFLLLAVRRAADSRRRDDERRQYLLLAVRSIRELAGNVARGNMQDDLDIFRALNNGLEQSLAENVHDEVRRMMQLAIAYWSLTKPKTSRKQLEYLADLLHPCLIDENMQKLVQSLG